MLSAMTPRAPGFFEGILAGMKPLLPLPILLVLLPALWWFFRATWKELDDEANAWRAELAAEGRSDFRPFVALAICAVVLTLQEYYGGPASLPPTLPPPLVPPH